MEKKAKEQLEKEIKAAKELRIKEIKAAEDAYEAFEIKGPEDVKKSFELQKALFELKGADEVKNFDEKMEAVKIAIEEAKTANDEEMKALRTDLDITIKAFDHVQTRFKNTVKTGNVVEKKSFNEYLHDAVIENQDAIKAIKKGDRLQFGFESKAVNDMTFALNFPTADSSVAFVRPGIIAPPPRRTHIRELLTGGSMGAKSTFDYVKETSTEGAIAAVAEGALKPQIELNLQEFSVRAEWLAGFLVISRNMLDDITGMSTYLQSRLPELLLRAEDTALLSGTGVTPQISGITTAGNFTAPTSSYTIDVEQLVGAIAQLEGYDRQADRILLNPADYYRLWLNKASGSGEYDLPGLVQVINGTMYIGGVPVYKSNALAVDKFIVGDWAMGANLIMREAPRVEFFFEDVDNVRKNMVTVRVEERIAFPIYGDNYFIYGDFGNAS